MAIEKSGATSVRAAFVQEIEDQILSGALQPGDRLPPAKELCAQMGVSLTVVNAGVSELVTKGFLTVKPRHGTYVADWRENGSAETLMSVLRHNGGKLTQHDVRSYCESRVALDPFVAELVIRRASNEQLKALGAHVERVRAAETTEALCAAATDFFHRMYQLSDNTILSLLYHSTIPPQRHMYAQFIEKNGGEMIKTHIQEVYTLLCLRDTEAVKQALITAQRMPLEGKTAIVSI